MNPFLVQDSVISTKQNPLFMESINLVNQVLNNWIDIDFDYFRP